MLRPRSLTPVTYFKPNKYIGLYSSYFKLHVLRPRSLTPVTYFSKLLGIRSLAAFLQLELFRVYNII
ncbi:hypothetical protein D7A89_11385 [Salmonella enterica]|nr:hypothetical protein BTN64_22255 [Salmonella enterica subsp. enterica serovar Enteritidis]EAB0891433.1 hypothetical protein [Salmonella enterica]ATT12332.1 hypothetical protein BTN73_22605 [Salmonella enterica subsp. enterica serovar Enteritidis]ATT18691.1 hypothetical protein BTN66_07050 [Salmonella enterica subsp. enterica serovar Enteritidis]ATT25566.1 hypothetical protein BTN70_21010 [Salmonella enterica subsp. enterica serovar Enteritidis]